MPLVKPASPPPRAAERDSIARHHGVELRDPYAWLRDDDWQEAIDGLSLIDPPIRAHLDAGADHVCVQVLTAGADLPRAGWSELAGALV